MQGPDKAKGRGNAEGPVPLACGPHTVPSMFKAPRALKQRNWGDERR
jgi:hypothetical protein